MADQLFDGRRFRLLTLVDNFSRESLAIRVGQRLTGDDVVGVLEAVAAERGAPQSIRVDNGPEFVSKSLDWWAYFNGVKLDFSRPGKPTDNAFIESFNGKFRQECLNQHWFLSLEDAQEQVDSWREDYNQRRPHSSLGDRTPVEFAKFFGPDLGPKNTCSLSVPSGSNLGAAVMLPGCPQPRRNALLSCGTTIALSSLSKLGRQGASMRFVRVWTCSLWLFPR